MFGRQRTPLQNVREALRRLLAHSAGRRRQPGPRLQVGGRHAALHRARRAARYLEDVDGNTLHRLRDVVGAADPRPRAEGSDQGAGCRRKRRAPASARRPSSKPGSRARVAMLMPSMERVRFVSSGTEAAMSALRVARAATQRDKIIKFEGCYHGHADAFLVQAGSGAMTLGVPTSPGVPAAVAADTLLARYNDLDSVEQACRQAHRADRRRSSSSRSPATWASCRRATAFCRACAPSAIAQGALLVFDEVISGFRAAAGGAQKATRREAGPHVPRQDHRRRAAGRRVRRARGRSMALVAPAGPVYQAGTLSGNPLAMTAGLWSLERAVAEVCTDISRGWAAGSRRGWRTPRARPAWPLQVNAFGSLLTPFFTTQPVRDYQSALTADTAAYGRFFRAMLERGVYPPPSQFEAWFLSAAHTEKDVDKTIKAARKAMKAVST